MSLPFFKPVKHLWKIKLTRKSKCYALIKVVSLHLELLMHFVNYMEVQFTNSYSPQQNGISEWKNKTLMEFVWSMLQSTKLSKSFWGQAITIAYYLQNRSYTSTLSGKTPYEYWRGKKPTFHHFKVFRCNAYAHACVLDDTWRKLEPKSIWCVFFGLMCIFWIWQKY